jgi:hypothetical protein
MQLEKNPKHFYREKSLQFIAGSITILHADFKKAAANII